MNQPTRPQKEKEQVPWCIQFSGRDLLIAAWGSKKGADLLYHFLHKASWEKKNKRENETLKDIKFQETTPKALEKSGLSLGCFHTYLKHFVSVGYISTEAYSGEYIVHTEVIQQAFSNTPEKPIRETGKRRQSHPECFNLKDCNFVTLPREDYERLVVMKDECFNLKEMFQSLKDSYAQTLVELKEMFQSLKQNSTIYAAQEADANTFFTLQSNALRDSESNDKESKKDDSAIAPFRTPTLLSLNLDEDVEDLPEAQEISYSHETLQTSPLLEHNTHDMESAVDPGYRRSLTNINPHNDTHSQTERPTRTKRERKPKAEKTARDTITVVVPAFTDGGRQVFDDWCSLFKVAVPCGAKTIEAANALYPMVHPWSEHLQVSLAQLLDKIQKWMYKTDRTGFYARGIRLTDVFRDFEGWQSAMERHGYSKSGETTNEDRDEQYSIRRLSEKKSTFEEAYEKMIESSEFQQEAAN